MSPFIATWMTFLLLPQRLMQPETDHSPPLWSFLEDGRDPLGRYHPKRYMDLLRDELVHWEVLVWAKQWALCVFDRGMGKKRSRDGESVASLEDESGRPQEVGHRRR